MEKRRKNDWENYTFSINKTTCEKPLDIAVDRFDKNKRKLC